MDRAARQGPLTDNPEHLRPWRNRFAAVAMLTVAVVAIVIAAFAL